MIIPDNRKDLKKKALDWIDICRHSVGQRQALYRSLRQWIETGKGNGEKSLNNRLYAHTDRLQSYLFSPSDLRFMIDYENYYPKIWKSTRTSLITLFILNIIVFILIFIIKYCIIFVEK